MINTVYHINSIGEPGLCRARTKACPFGGNENHFESKELAQMFYESKNSVNLFKKGFLSKVHVKRVLKETDFKKRNLEGFCYVGSRLYNLHHENSDKDVCIFVEGKGVGLYKTINETDYSIVPIDGFINRVIESSPMNIDILKSRKLTLVGNYAYLLNNIRINENQYIERSHNKAYEDFRNALNSVKTKERASKSLKVALRSVVLASKMINDGQLFNPEFDNQTKEFFYLTLNKLEALKNTLTSDELLTFSVKESENFFVTKQ